MGRYVLATVVLWGVSALLAVGGGLVLAAMSIDARRPIRYAADAVIALTRGVPTSLVVVIAGLAALRATPPGWLPDLFPGTETSMTLVAWAVLGALCYGSVGHLAVIFRTAATSLGRNRTDQLRALGLVPRHRFALLMRESVVVALPPAGARLVHHLHNTAFAALFPVADLFGWIQDRANTTFEVTRYALLGGGIYVVLSGLIWFAVKALEIKLSIRPEHRTGTGGGRHRTDRTRP